MLIGQPLPGRLACQFMAYPNAFARLHIHLSLVQYSWRIIREEYKHMTALACDDMYDTSFTFSPLQDSGVYEQ